MSACAVQKSKNAAGGFFLPAAAHFSCLTALNGSAIV